ncbi:fibronectin type III domain-containing protein [Nocardioides marmoriginsengisoli]|uniref:fibronectin type III domain-containing protein n=1 Tax=Nocardioides marmoriginsengisoli TaxID=661483 RepID=UPI00160F9E77|nr:fibronectin type III domain-containing protein [Nocardioides marmoriginsengisoli]
MDGRWRLLRKLVAAIAVVALGLVGMPSLAAAADPGAPGMPTGVSASPQAGRQVTVTWTAPEDDGGNLITAYKVSNSFDSSVATTTEPTWTGAFPTIGSDVPLTFTVRAVNAAGESDPSDASAPVLIPAVAPSEPRSVSATGGNGQAQVSWLAPLGNGGAAITGYAVTSVPGGQTCVTAGALSCVVPGLTNGTTYRFTVSASTIAGPSLPSAVSNAVTPIGPFAAVGTPRIIGVARVGATLRVNPGTWSPSPKLSFQWLRNGRSIARATGATYVLTAADRGTRTRVRVTGARVGVVTKPMLSSPTAVVGYGILANRRAPTITGTAKVGKTLTANPGTWSTSGVTIKYQWLRDGRTIRGATRKTYRLTKAAKTHRFSVRVTATKAGYKAATKTSGRTAKVTGVSNAGGGGGGNCTPGYSPCLPPKSDYDCAGGSGDGPGYAHGPIYVTGSDPYDLDRDGDGIACED